jgi:dihydroorotate dehydrogenase (NAD+) catalytic subunit
MGGVCTGDDALDLVAVGASAVALGTVLFTDPFAPGRIRSEIESIWTASGATSADGIGGFTRASASHHGL